MEKCELCGKYLLLHEIDKAEEIAWFSCPSFLAGEDEHSSISVPLTEFIAENQQKIHDLAVLGNYGWEITCEEEGDFTGPTLSATRTWNMAEVQCGGCYDEYREYYEDRIPDKVYIEYAVDLAEEATSFVVWEGGKNSANSVSEHDVFDNVMELALNDELFTPTSPLRYKRLVETDNKMRYTWLDLVQVTEDYSSLMGEADRGDYFIHIENNCNVQPDECSVFHPVSDEEAKKILNIADTDGIDEAYKEMSRIVDE